MTTPVLSPPLLLLPTSPSSLLLSLPPSQFQGEPFLGGNAKANLCIGQNDTSKTGLMVSVDFRMQYLFNALNVSFDLGEFDFPVNATLTYASMPQFYDCVGPSVYMPAGFRVFGTAMLFNQFEVDADFYVQPELTDGDLYVTVPYGSLQVCGNRVKNPFLSETGKGKASARARWQ